MAGCDWVRARGHIPPRPPQEGRLPGSGATLWAALHRARGGGRHADIQDEGPAPRGHLKLKIEKLLTLYIKSVFSGVSQI